MRQFVISFFCVAFLGPADAQVILGPEFDTNADLEMCRTSVDGESVFVIFDKSEDSLRKNYSFRERRFGASGNINCPGFVSLRIVTPLVTDEERELFCLVYDKDNDTISGFSQGERNAYLMCKEPSKPLCERVNDSKEWALAMAGFGAGTAAAAAGTQAAATAAGVSAVAHSSGAVILTGSAGYIAGTLGTIGATAFSILTAPATLAAATITLVAAGGAVYVCLPEDTEMPIDE